MTFLWKFVHVELAYNQMFSSGFIQKCQLFKNLFIY